MYFLEILNVGNSYGVYLGNIKCNIFLNYQEKYFEVGNFNGLEVIILIIVFLLDENGRNQVFIVSNDIIVFSIFDIEIGKVSSYYFDIRKFNFDVVKFDEFQF